jgi:hypothetical protein
MVNNNKKLSGELVHDDGALTIERFDVPGGFLFVTRFIADDIPSVASTFVPVKNAFDEIPL